MNLRRPIQDTSQMLVAVALGLIGYIIAGYVGYNNTSSSITNRLTALEIHQSDNAERMQRVENKIDRLFEAMTGRKP
jgi:hypothetical protein